MTVEDQYFVAISMFGPEQYISAEKFDELKKARCTLTSALRIEEAFEIVVANYIKFEKYLLSESLEHMVRQRWHTFHSFSQMRTEINVLLSGLLSAARFYRDSLPHHARLCIPNVTRKEIDVPFNVQYDAAFEFRFMECMRNYSQHNGLPIDSIRLNDPNSLFSVDVFSTRDVIRKAKFKVHKEMPERVDLRRYARIYLRGLAIAHGAIREKMEPSISAAWAVIKSQRDAYEFEEAGSKAGLAAFHYHGTDLAGKCWLGVDIYEKRAQLIKDNQGASSPAIVDGIVSNRMLDPSEIPPPEPFGFD